MRLHPPHSVLHGEAGLWLVIGLLFLADSISPLVQTTPGLPFLRIAWPILLPALNVLLAVLLGRSLALSIRQGPPETTPLPTRRLPTPFWMLGLALIGLGTALGIYQGWDPRRALALGLSLGLGWMLIALAIRRKSPLRFLALLLTGGLSALLLGKVLPDWNAGFRFLLGAGIFSLIMGALMAWASRNPAGGRASSGRPAL